MFFLFLFFNETEEVYYITEKLMVGIVFLSYLDTVVLISRLTFSQYDLWLETILYVIL